MLRTVALIGTATGALAPIHADLAASTGEALVTTTGGPVRGTVNPKLITYLGIPYAEPPVGELRWQPPRPKRAWRTPLDATKFGHHCLQANDASPDEASEDCLSLNVYVPAQSSKLRKLRPVMAWIHGGGNGSGRSDATDPKFLIQTGDVVVVSMNYRLNVFGFLSHPALDAEGHAAANYGLMDQQLALNWIQENIARFGGDPQNVTIFGVSAGGMNVSNHLISPLSRGLFAKAIIQSGSYQLDTPSLANSQALGQTFANRAGCKDQTAACLRALPPARILAHLSPYGSPQADYNGSTVDGKILIEKQRTAFQTGRFQRVPILIGNTSEEGRMFMPTNMTSEAYRKVVESNSKLTGKDPNQALTEYPLEQFPSASEAASAVYGDSQLACGAQAAARLVSRWTSTYAYEFADPNAGPSGATHGADMKYLFVFFKSSRVENAATRAMWDAVNGSPDTLAPDSRRLSETMRASWTGFAASGDPKSAAITPWPLASAGIVQLKPPVPQVISNADYGARHHCAFWNDPS